MSSPKTPPEAAPARRARAAFSPAWLRARLAELVPQFPQVPLCVAFSGGGDSTALLATLARLSRPRLRLRALHVDHHLQSASGEWAAHCRSVARALRVPLEVLDVRVRRTRGESPEARARNARYAALAAALAPGEVLLTAHHQDDQLETLLLQLMRGAGVAGLAAIAPVAPLARSLLVRPLLGASAQALRAWLTAEGLSWVEDPSNQDERLDRNFLRARIVPLLRERWPSAALTVARSASHAAEAQRLLDELGAADAARAAIGAALSAKVLRTLPAQRRRNALRYWIAARGVQPPPTRRLQEIAGPLLAARPDTRPFVAWAGVRVAREADVLRLASGAAARSATGMAVSATVRWHWREDEPLVLPAGTLTVRRDARGPLDLAVLPPELMLRARSGGERLRPLAGGVRRSLKGLLQEARVPREERARMPLIYAGEQLVAVADRWLDASVQAGRGSMRRGRILWRLER